jgi:hypothetical protein
VQKRKGASEKKRKRREMGCGVGLEKKEKGVLGFPFLSFFFNTQQTKQNKCNQTMMHNHLGDSKLTKYYLILKSIFI